jgi:hypothetical protein
LLTGSARSHLGRRTSRDAASSTIIETGGQVLGWRSLTADDIVAANPDDAGLSTWGLVYAARRAEYLLA